MIFKLTFWIQDYLFFLYRFNNDQFLADKHLYTKFIHVYKIQLLGSWKENEIAGFFVFSQHVLIDHFRLELEPPSRLEIGEKLP